MTIIHTTNPENKNCKSSYLNNLRFKKLSDRLKRETQKLLQKEHFKYLKPTGLLFTPQVSNISISDRLYYTI